MHYNILVQVVEELSSLLAGARVERVLQGEDGGLYLLFRKDRKSYIVLLSPDRTLPRLHLVIRKPKSTSDPHPLVLNLRSRIPGSRLASIALLNNDRIVVLRFARNDTAYNLFFELTGASANLFFTDADMRIITSYYPASASGQARPLLLPGSQYVFPQRRNQAVQIAAVAFEGHTSSPNEAAAEHYERLAENHREAALRTRMRSYLRKALGKAKRKRAALVSDMQTARQVETYRQKGDLILANLQKLKTGMGTVEMPGYDGVLTAVELNAKLTPRENAEAYFRRYKKAKTGLPIIEERIRRTEEEIAELQTRISRLELFGGGDDLLGIKSIAQGSPPVAGTEKLFHRPAADEVPGIKKILYRGWVILVGANASANDALTTRLARPDDLWLHAEGLPGSHVLVRNPTKREVPSEILLKAAGIAAMHSKGKTAGKVTVTYTYARYVRKPKGAKPGLVHLARRKAIIVRPDNDDQAR